MVIDYINEKCNLIVSWLLDMFLKLSGLNQLLVLLGLAFLIVVGLVTVMKKTIKTAIAVSLIFIIIVVIWSLLSFIK